MEDYTKLESCVRHTYARVEWSHKIHEKQADIYSKYYKWLETAKIVAASLTSVGIVSLLFTDQLWVKLISAVLSFISVCISTYFKSFDLQSMVTQNKSVAHSLLRVRDELMLLLFEIQTQNREADVLYDAYAKLSRQANDIFDNSPITTDEAVEQARIALNVSKDNSFEDAEVDQSLPSGLRKGGTNE